MKKNKKPAAKRNVYCFEPDDDVRKMVEEAMQLDPTKDRTQILNEAVRARFPEKYLPVAEKELQKMQSFVDLLKRNSLKRSSSNDSTT